MKASSYEEAFFRWSVKMKAKYLSEVSDEYIQKMKKFYTIDSDTLSSMDWLLLLGGSCLTILTVVALIYWISKLFLFLLSCKAGRSNFRDTLFWKRMGVGLAIIMLLMAGSLLLIFENLYNILVMWGWGTS